MSTDITPGTDTDARQHTATTATTRATHTAPNFWASVWLVATREIVSRLRSKAFLISTGILLLIAVGSVVAGGLMSANPSTTQVAVVGAAGAVVGESAGLTMVSADDVAAAEALVRDGTVEAAVIPSDSLLGVSVIALDSPPSAVMNALSVAPTVELLEPAEQGGFLVYIVALGFGLVFFMSALTFGSTIAQSVVEEKQTRVVEILISAIRARTLLAGKVIGNTVLAMGQILVLAAIAVIGLTIIGQTQLLGTLGAPILWFAVFFLFGFVLLAALFAAAAAMVSRQEDIGSTTFPLTLLIMAPYFLVIFFNDNPVVLTIMSYVPFSAPVGMPMRLFLGEAQWWEPILSLAILIATCMAAILVGAKIYQNSLLRMGARVKLGEALRG
jgi:ABC-2 type transport system permease protein